MKLFLTGGTGFIGSYVLRDLLAAGHEVIALRRNSSSNPVIPLPRQPQWCEGNLTNLDSVQLEGVEAVLHLAASGVSPKQVSWDELVQVNVHGSLKLLERAADAGVRRCVIAGTSHEYGNAARRYHAIPPDAALEPLSPYGASKAAAFQILRTFAIVQRMEFFYGRIFSAYGEGQFTGNFWPSLCRAARQGEDFPMTLGRQVSDFTPIAEVANHLLVACSRPDITAGVPLVANVASGKVMSLLNFAEAEWKRLNGSGRLLPGMIPERPNQIERYVPDLTGLISPTSTLTLNS